MEGNRLLMRYFYTGLGQGDAWGGAPNKYEAFFPLMDVKCILRSFDGHMELRPSGVRELLPL